MNVLKSWWRKTTTFNMLFTLLLCLGGIAAGAMKSFLLVMLTAFVASVRIAVAVQRLSMELKALSEAFDSPVIHR